MEEESITIKAFNKEWEIKIETYPNMPEDFLKYLAVNKFIEEFTEVLYQENGLNERTQLMNTIDYTY